MIGDSSPLWHNLPSMNQRPGHYHRGMPPTGHKVSLERLEKFRRIYKEVHGEEITTAEASAMIHPLLAVYKLFSQSLPETEEPSPSPPPPAPTAREEV
jgi:hypothetical protein